jgi:hypothetical protein
MNKSIFFGVGALFLAALSGCSSSTTGGDAGTTADTGTPPADTGTPEACSPVSCTAGMCGMVDDGCGGMLNCTDCTEAGATCSVTGNPPQGVSGCACVMSTSDTAGGCCEETNAWIAANKGNCGANFCSGPCEPYCSCYTSKCKGQSGCP